MKTNGLTTILKQGESQTVEFKVSFQDETIQTVGAFANVSGGTILIGVNDDGIPVGVAVGKETLREITDRIASCTEPRVVPDVRVQTVRRRTIISIQVPEYPIKPVAVRGRCYRRVGRSNRHMPPAEIAQMHLASTGTSWDALPARDGKLGDLDLTRVRHYMTLATNIGRRNFPPGTDPLDALRKLELIRDNRPTWAAVLLFGKRPQSPLIQATVHCGRFRSEIEIADDRMIEGSIIDQVDETMDFLKKHTNVRFVITGKPQRDQIWDYPLEALREAVINAICHRDYSDGSDIQIKVFDDHIRIWSPGLLPFGVTFEDLYRRSHASKPRNKLIAQVFYDLEIIERYGSGIHRMLDACASAGLPEPTLDDSTGGLLITFRKSSVTERVGEGAVNQVIPPTSGQVTGQVTVQVTGQVHRLMEACDGEVSRSELQERLAIRHRDYFNEAYLLPALKAGLIEMTSPEKPRSSKQKYRLSAQGRAIIQNANKELI
jgi:ATP-dependent DNA helicase RecG